MTCMPASRRARATTLTPRSWPSSPTLARTTRRGGAEVITGFLKRPQTARPRQGRLQRVYRGAFRSRREHLLAGRGGRPLQQGLPEQRLDMADIADPQETLPDRLRLEADHHRDLVEDQVAGAVAVIDPKQGVEVRGPEAAHLQPLRLLCGAPDDGPPVRQGVAGPPGPAVQDEQIDGNGTAKKQPDNTNEHAHDP